MAVVILLADVSVSSRMFAVVLVLFDIRNPNEFTLTTSPINVMAPGIEFVLVRAGTTIMGNRTITGSCRSSVRTTRWC